MKRSALVLAVTTLIATAISIAPAQAAEKDKKKAVPQVKYCNELPYNQCVQCAISRGYPPSQYGPYCSNRR